MLLESASLTKILKERDELHLEIATYFSTVLNLIAIQRGTASVLEMSDGGKSLRLETLFKKLYQRTFFPPTCRSRACGISVKASQRSKVSILPASEPSAPMPYW